MNDQGRCSDWPVHRNIGAVIVGKIIPRGAGRGEATGSSGDIIKKHGASGVIEISESDYHDGRRPFKAGQSYSP